MSEPSAPSASWWHPDELLRPGTSAVVAFVLAFLSLDGSSLMSSAGQALFNSWWGPDSDLITYVAVYVVGILLPTVAAIYLARRAITDEGAVTWELMVARSAVVLAVVAIVYTAVTLLGVAIHT